MVPAHVDPTMAYHERLYVCSGDDIVDVWPVDLRGWCGGPSTWSPESPASAGPDPT